MTGRPSPEENGKIEPATAIALERSAVVRSRK